MKTSIGFRAGITVCALVFLAGAVCFLSLATHAESAAEKARKKAEAAVAKAVEARKCREAEDEVIAAEAWEAKAKAKKDELAKHPLPQDATSQQKHDRNNDERDAYRDVERAHDRVELARHENEKFKKPCGDAEKAEAEAQDALKKAEELLAEKIEESGDKDKPPKKLKDEKDILDKLRKDLGPAQATAVAPKTDNTVQTKTGNGLHTITFDTPPGRVTVNLPDDLMAGDTISGTVIEEPKGSNKAEKEKNQKVLEGMVIDLEGTKVKVGEPRFTWVPPAPQSASPRYQLRIIEISQSGSPATEHVYSDCFIPAYAEPKLEIGRIDTLKEKVNIHIPSLGQTGRPIQITGPFDGNFDNTTVQVGDQTTVPLAASPREIIVQSPSNVVGPAQITVRDGNRETKGEYRNLKVDLTAPKTTLVRNEKTELKVEVEGLKGISQPVPLHLTNGGAVTMSGGNSQTMSITPSDVQSNGSYTTTRTITGVQTGGWIATATVVNFNTCLEDDGNPSRVLLFNVATGDFAFCQQHGESSGQKQIEISTFPFSNDSTGGVRVQAGDGLDTAVKPGWVSIGPGASNIRTGNFIFADFDFSNAQIHVELNEHSHTGTATVQTTNPKQTFTITDRDTRNNTCACK